MQKMASVICGYILTVSEVLLYSLILSLWWHNMQVAGEEVRKEVRVKYLNSVHNIFTCHFLMF